MSENKGLPAGWKFVKLGEVCEKMSNGSNAKQYDENVGFPISRIETIWNETIDLNRIKHVVETDDSFVEKYSLKKDDILFSHINSDSHLGKTAIFKNQTKILIHGINLLLIRLNNNVSPDFFNYQFKFKRSKGEFISIAQKSVNQSSINQPKLKNIYFVCPPKDQQLKIVSKVEELFSELDKGIENLKLAQQQLKTYRQSVLKWAFEGRLTNQNVKEGELPKGWNITKLENVGKLFCGQSSPVNEVNKIGKGILYVTGPEQWNGGHIEKTKWTLNPKRVVPDGTIFITVKGAGVGKLFPGVSCAIGRDVYAYLPNQHLNFKYLFYALKFGIDSVIVKAQGDIPGLAKNHILDHEIGVCSNDEQERIVQEIEDRISVTDKFEETIIKSLRQSDALRQTILKKAFTGNLDK